MTSTSNRPLSMVSTLSKKLSYLCIYNPDLETGEAHLERQIVFYYGESDDIDQQLRYIGLAQGVNEFSRDKGITNCHPRIGVTQLVGRSNLYTAKDVSSAELLIADLVQAYKRFRLHNGTFQGYLETHTIPQLTEFVQPWWTSWADNWNPCTHDQGSRSLFEGISLSKGQLTSETVETMKAAINSDRDPGFVDMVVTRYDDESSIEYQGCVWAGNSTISRESVADLVQWVQECHHSGDRSAFLEKSGFVYHLGLSKIKDSNPEDEAPSESLTIKKVTQKTMESVSYLMDIVPFRLLSGTSTPVVKDQGLEDDVEESRFLIGLRGSLEDVVDHEQEDNSPYDQDESHIENSREEPLHQETIIQDRSNSWTQNTVESEGPSFDGSEGPRKPGLDGNVPDISTNAYDSDPLNSSITSKFLFLRHNQKFSPFKTIIYLRRPFTFTLIFSPTSSSYINNPSNYISLHRRLAPLSEPIYSDLARQRSSLHATTSISDQSYYLVTNPLEYTVQSSLPLIPKNQASQFPQVQPPAPPSSDSDTTSLEFQRLIILHIHQTIASITVNYHGETEKLVSTIHGWCVYWTKLNDQRQVLYIRKAPRSIGSGKSNTEAGSSLLGSLGKDAKKWLDEFQYSGTV